MRVQQWMLTAALVAVPALAAAQATTTTTTPDSTSTTQTTTTTAPQGTTQTTTTQTTTRDVDNDFDDVDSPGGWFASAQVGSDFGQSADNSSVDFGGSLGYTSGWFGAEFLAGFTPNFQMSNRFFSDEPQVNTYMFNLMAGVPIGPNKNFQPFVSGGIGAMTLRSDDLSGDDPNDFNENFASDDSQFGSNIGFGVMGFAENVGVRADVRYFRAFGDNALENALDLDPNTFDDSSPINVLPGLDFWRANIGLAFRW
jgi:opacity protein-like surface antigen